MSFNKPSASTLGGNPISTTAGLAVLNYIESHHLVARSRELGDILRKGLEVLCKKYGFVQEVRGMGLMLGMVFSAQEGGQIVDIILEEMKERGFIVGKNGMNRNVLAFQPPLVIFEKDIKEMLEALDQVLSEIEC